jgi:IS4 transposase
MTCAPWPLWQIITSSWQGGEDGTEATTEGEGVESHRHQVFGELLPLVERLHDDGCGRDKAGNRPSHPIRVVQVQTTPHVKRGTERGGSTGPSDGILRIATNLLDVPAETIAVLDEQRWTLEILFRFFKHVLGWRVKRNCLPRLRNLRHSLRTRDESPREPRIMRQSATG